METVDNYIQDGLTHLSNSKYYHRLQSDFNPSIEKAITKFLNNAHQRGLIDSDTHKFLSPPVPSRTPLIYFLKKLHKQPISVRPIVSHINSATSNISAFIDKLLKPIVKEIPHILSNSSQLINDLQGINCSNNHTLLASLDITSLYPNIPIQESISIILDFIKEQNNPMHPPIYILNTLLSFVLNYNCFNFGDLFFLQVHGIAMGTKLAPNYANLFMSDFETRHVFSYALQPSYYRRYIDDIFLIWDHSSEELDGFIDHLNSVHPTIKFTKSISDTVITYLDLDIYKKDNILHTRTHFKSTNTFSYLHGQSNHPSSTFKGVTKGENIRILRNTSEEEIYQNTMEFINKQFKIRKYPDHFTTTPIVPFSQRQSFLHSTRSTSSHIGPTFITTHDSSISLKPILEEDWPRITSHNELRKTYRETPRITYKHSPNLSQLLTRAKLDHDIKNDLPYHPAPTIQSISFPAKNIKCRHQQCGSCPQLSERSHFSSNQTKHYYPIQDIYSCDTTYGIYLLQCKLCNKQYIGETHTTIRSRMKHHRNMSKTATYRPIYAHILNHQKDFNIFTLTIIDRVEDINTRKQKEIYYINLLKTKIPFGLNVISQHNANPNPNPNPNPNNNPNPNPNPNNK